MCCLWHWGLLVNKLLVTWVKLLACWWWWSLLYPTETGALQWLFSPTGAGEKGKTCPIDDAAVFVCVFFPSIASSASLMPLQLSVDTFPFMPCSSHFLTFHWTSVLLFFSLLYITLSLPQPHPHIFLASGPEDVGAALGRAGGGAKGEERFRMSRTGVTLCMLLPE